MTLLLTAAPWFAFVLIVPLLLRRRPRLRDFHHAGVTRPLLSIIVPARNEALNIGPCVAALLESTYHNREIIVVDDNSTDATGDIARALGASSNGAVRVVSAEPLPDGWIGKPWACWTGFNAARGELLLFTDADTRHNEELHACAVGALQQTRAGLLSVLPRQIMETFWERVVLPHIFLGIFARYGSAARINSSDNPRQAIANGQFILMDRETYTGIDGHRGVRDQIVEDVALAQHVVAAGSHLMLAHAPDLMATRMYRSLGEITEGWSKNLSLGARLSLPAPFASLIIGLAILLGLLLWVVPPVVLTFGLVVPALSPYRIWALTVCGASLAGWLYVHLRLGSGISAALLYPLGALATVVLLARSALRGTRVEWRGRQYRVPSI